MERLLDDWIAFTEEKWRAVNDSQLGWKPLRGRWNGWEEIYNDSFKVVGSQAADNTSQRFKNSQTKASGTSAVACFLRDLDMLRQGIEFVDQASSPRCRARWLWWLALGQFTHQQSAHHPLARYC